MEALVLAGGFGTRLRPVIDGLPKVMAPVGGKPFLLYLVEQLQSQGFINICLAVGYRSNFIADYFKDGSAFGVKLTYSDEEQPLGTAGAIKKAAATLPEEFLVLNGDSYLDIAYRELIDFHLAKKSLITMALTEAKQPNRYGSVQLGPADEITSFLEKAASRHLTLINAGIYVIQKSVLAGIGDNICISLEREVLPHYANRGLFGLTTRGFFIDIGTPSSYRLVKNGLPGRKEVRCLYDQKLHCG